MANLESHDEDTISSELSCLFTRKELMDIVLWLHSNYDKTMLSEHTEEELLTLISDDYNILSYVTEKWKDAITATPNISQKSVEAFFSKHGLEAHYLMSKPVEEWDGYDSSNYHQLMFKHGKTRRVYAIFSSDVTDEEKYAVTTKPSYFFDTEEEAEEELQKILSLGQFTEGDLKIMSLWKIN